MTLPLRSRAGALATLRLTRRHIPLALTTLLLSLSAARAEAPVLAISAYHKVSEARITRSVTEFTFRASVTNTGPAIAGAIATVTSLSPSVTIVENTLTFGPIAVNQTSVSADTFTFRVDRSVPFDFSLLQWSITPSVVNQTPVADAGPDQTTTLGAMIQLDGAGSSDADGDALTFDWTFESLPQGSAAAIANPTAVNPMFVADVPGSYRVRLIVNDGTVDSAPDIVVVSTENSAPVADAGPDRAAFAGETVTLDGTGSSDADGDPLTFSWTLIARPLPSAAVLSGATTVSPSFTVDAVGTYRIQLTVHDGLTASAPDIVEVTTGNSRPEADAGPDQTVALGETVTLDGRGSSDANGDTLTFSWSFTTRPVGSTALLDDSTSSRPTFVTDVPGVYVVQLVVGDGLDVSDPDTVMITAGIPDVSLAAPDSDAAEAGNDPGTFRFTRTGSTASPVTIDFSVEGSAGNGIDYALIPGSVTIPIGAASVDLIIEPIDDDSFELPEFVRLELRASASYTVATPDPVNVSIQDDDTRIDVSASDSDASEFGPDQGTFTITSNLPAAVDLVVFYSMSGTASPGVDYQQVTGSVTIPAGASSATVGIVPIDDALSEGPETAVLVLASHPSYTVGVGQAFVTITDDERPAVTIVASDERASEEATEIGTFTITRTGPTIAPLTVTYAIDGNAVNGVDFVALPSSVVIPAGSATAAVTITPIDDVLFEGSESVILTLTGTPAYVVVTPGIAGLQILDNDGARVTIVATDPIASEAGDTGTFTVTRTGGNLSQPLLVQVRRSGTASSGTDFVSLGGANFFVTIPANALSATVTITPIANATAENDETVILTINPNAAYVIGTPGEATVTIVGP